MNLLDKLSGLAGGYDDDVLDAPPDPGYVACDCGHSKLDHLGLKDECWTKDCDCKRFTGLDAVRKLKEECQEKQN